MKSFKKSSVILMVALLIGMMFMPNIAVRSQALSNFTIEVAFVEGYDSAQGHVEYQIDGGEWEQVTENATINIDYDVTSLKFRVVPATYYMVNYDAENDPRLNDGREGGGISFAAGGMDEARALLEGEGYEAILTGDPTPTTISLTGIAFRGGGTAEEHAPVTIDIIGPGLEYWNGDYPSRINFFINTPQGEHEEANIKWGGAGNLSWKGDYTISDPFVQGASGVSTKNPVEITYHYDGSGTVSIPVGISNASTKITSFKVNGQEFADQCPQTDEQFLDALNGPRSVGFEISNVPYADHYDVKIVAEFDDLMGGFGWNYLPEETQDGDSREDCIAHGTLSFIKGEYNGMVFDTAAAWNGYRHNGVSQIFEWVDGDKNYSDEHDAWGSAAFPRGAVITFKLVPDEGYQLTSLFGDKDLEALEDPGVYKITMTGGMNSHLQATFEEVDDEVKLNTDAVKEGTISQAENKYGEGTMRLDVSNANVNGDSRANFEHKAEEENGEIDEYLEIGLSNVIYKANDGSDVWEREVKDLDNEAEIKLVLNQDYSNKENIFIIHEHDGQYEKIDVSYNAEDNSITFKTKGFSNYAIASTTPEEEENNNQEEDNKGQEGNQEENPPHGSGDKVYSLTDGDNTLEFVDGEGQDDRFELVFLAVSTITDEQLASMGATREEAEAAIEEIKAAVPKEFIDYYVVMLMDKNDGEAIWGRQQIKLTIKMTDNMIGYENFRLIDVSQFGEPEYTGEEIPAKMENGTIIFELKELGNFVLVADKIEEEGEQETKPAPTQPTQTQPTQTQPTQTQPTQTQPTQQKSASPATGDQSNIAMWLFLALVSGICVTVYAIRRRKDNA
ncbi:MAG: hypothetical protein J5928_04355 [Firmicutes bacterium]|nr:hypothetical protein [Bacillota bacterium]